MPLRVSACLLLLSPLAPGCSIPQFDSSQPPPVQMVDRLIRANHYRRALAQLTSGPQPAAGGTAEHDSLLSRVQLGLGQLESAMQFAEKAIAADRKNAAFHVQLAAVAGRIAEHAGMLKQISMAKLVRKELEEAVALDPNNADAIYGLLLFSEIAPSFLGGDKAHAQQLAQQLVEVDAARGYLAQAALAQNRKDAVSEEVFLKKAVAADPQSYDAHIALAVWAEKAGPTRMDEADEQACEALYLDPTRSQAWRILAEFAASAGCLLEVDGLIAIEQKFNPDDWSPAYFAAVAMLGKGNHLDAAEALLKRYLNEPQEGDSPSAGLARYQLAVISEKRGNPNEALDRLRIAVSEDPTLSEAKKDLKRLEHSGAAN